MKRVIETTLFLALSPFLALAISAQTESTNPKPGSGSIKGHVTIAGKPRAGVNLVVTPASRGSERTVIATTHTDDEGAYHLRGLKAGDYSVSTIAPDAVLESANPSGPIGIQVILGEGESISGINFNLSKGGVITGTVTDSDGSPVTGQFVELEFVDDWGVARRYVVSGRSIRAETDDRGIYRLYGLQAGKYLVTVGEATGESLRSVGGMKPYIKVYHPNAGDADKATRVDVRRGEEATGIDIKLSARLKSFVVSGSVIDGETRKPMPSVSVQYGGQSPAYREVSATPNGRFRVENLTPGRYFFRLKSEGSEYFSQPVSVDVSDADVTDVELIGNRGGSASGIVIVEGPHQADTQSLMSQIRIAANFGDRAERGIPSMSYSAIGPDGRFRISGIPPGKIILLLAYNSQDPQLKHIRIERNGVILPRTQEASIGPGEHLSGFRVVLAHASGKISGRVINADGTIPTGWSFQINLRNLDPRSMGGAGGRSDARAGFLVQSVVPGTYELMVIGSSPPAPTGAVATRIVDKQTVTVAGGQTTNVTITLNPVER